MNFSWYIALRYFRSRRGDSGFLSFIKFMSIAGVAIGSAGLLIALSIVHGFKSVIHEKITGFAPHVTVHSFSGQFLHRADTLTVHLSSMEGVEEVQAVLLAQVMIQASADISGTLLKGISGDKDVTDLAQYISRGTYDLSQQPSGFPGLIIGSAMARNIGADVGSRVTVFALDGLPSPFNTPEIEQFTVTGIYQTGIARFDDNFALAGIESLKSITGAGTNQASMMEIRAGNSRHIEQLHAEISEQLRFPFITESIYHRYRNIFAWVDLQEETIPLVIGVMIIVAAFNLIGTVLMMVLERVRDIGILKTIGAKSRIIKKIFILEGVFVAVSGLAAGILISLLFYWLQSQFGIIPLSEENYYMSTAPVQPQLLDFVIVSGVTLILCSVASWLPARIAASTDPVQVLSFGK
ncbi:MAG: ABC transporter permease [Balneolaceae bacterium]|nr:MAG: ABC transporter permease [Balneolaceae bacterium]